MKTSLQWLRVLALIVTLFLGAGAARAEAPDFSASVKSVNKTSTFLLDTIGYTVTLDNTRGTADALDVFFTDRLPRGIEVQLFSLDGVPQALSLLSDGLPIGTIPAGASRTVTILGVVTGIPIRPDAAQYVNNASWTYRFRQTPGAPLTNARFTTNSVTTKAVRLEPSMAIANVNLGVVLGASLGNEITYTLTIPNTGTLDSAGTTLTNLIPVGATYVAGSTTLNGVTLPDLGVAGPFVAGGLVNSPGEPSGQINIGEAAIITFKVRSLTLPVVNLAVVDADGPGPIPPLNVNGSTQNLLADLSLAKTDNQTSAAPGSTITYTLSVRNNAGVTVGSVRVVDNLPPELENPIWTASAGTYNAATGQWTGLNLAAGQTVTLSLQARVAALSSGTLVNTATVFAPDGVTDSNPANNTSNDTDSLALTADLGVAQGDGVAFVTAGAPFSTRITVSNAGPSALSNLTLSASLPAALQNPIFAPDEGAYNPQSGVWSGLDLRAGQSVQMTLSGTVASGASGSFTTSFSVAPPPGALDLNNPNNSSSDTNTVAPPSLILTQTVDKTDAKPGETLTYTITYRNGGTIPIGGVKIRASIPDLTGFVAASYAPLPAGLTSCALTTPTVGAGGNLDWNFSGNLPPGASGTVSFQVKIQ